MPVLTLRELLSLRGLKLDQRVKLARHNYDHHSISELRAQGLFEAYQSIQSSPVFECDVLVSFEAVKGQLAKLIGIYRVVGKRPATPEDVPTAIRNLGWKSGDLSYQLVRLRDFDSLIDRVLIDWGPNTRAWHQWLSGNKDSECKDKAVVGIQESDFMGAFPGYADLMLNFSQLQRLTRSPQHNPEWHARLRAIRAIYLIQHRSSGQLYVGSAGGSEGLWGRWSDYATTRHGGNAGLMDLLDSNPEAHHDFVFSVLRALPSNLPSEELLRYERFEKEKLGTRVHGLTRN